MKISSGKMKKLFCVPLTQATQRGAGVTMNSYDPDGGYWDYETNEWVNYDDMERING